MTTDPPITFFCPSCATKLTVPSQLAGVTGPCPTCQVLIQAPYPVPLPGPSSYSAPPAYPTYQAPAYPPYQVPAPPQQDYAVPQQLEYQAPAPPPQQQQYHYHDALPQRYEPPLQQPPPGQQPYSPGLVRPEPRQLPNRSEPVEAPTRVRSEPSGEIRAKVGNPVPPVQRHRRNRVLRLLVPLMVLSLLIGAAYGVKKFLQIDRTAENVSGPPVTGPKPSTVREIFPEETADSFEALTQNSVPEALPVGAPEMPQIGNQQSAQPVESTSVDGGKAALDVLEKFLAMKTLAERMPHLESKRSESELESSVLNGPLPEVREIAVDVRDSNSIEQLVDYYYQVDFTGETGGINPQTMLVRTRGTSPPKVVVDPFLDLFGGRFAEYASTPRKEAGTFQVIISAGAFCYEDVPTPERKFTLKILSRENSREIAKAYFGRRSKIGRMLEDEILRYGQAMPCTVFIRWNMDEDPERPFLEALDITSQNWNP